ncbi:hypothetical protein AB0N05_17645 [Nocardia sp. NPDC051030]|uniref:hypothetical protein n=1 Tax=Nocardia sp. NPDC051030 TaxID=3155162 RepID=UPI003439679F
MMFGGMTIAGAAVLMAATTGTGVAAGDADPAPGTESGVSEYDVKQILHEHDRHVGERLPVYGLVYSDLSVWTLGFVTAGPSEFFTIDGTRVEITGPRGRELTRGDVFTGTITITGRSDFSDPIVTLEDATVIDHRTP